MKYTLKFDKTDERDLVLQSFFHPTQLPKSVDLRDKMSPVVDQGQLGSCTANAIGSGFREYLLLQKGDTTRVSRLYLYWHERALEGTINEDAGAMIRDGFKTLQKFGVAPEQYFPYDINRFTDTPSPMAESEAKYFRIKEYHRVTNHHNLKSSLAEGYPVVIGMKVFESFESQEVANTGIVPLPEPTEQNLGGHALCVVGYKDGETEKDGVYIVRNSWGERWGDKGYCYIPYSFIDKKIIVDMWTGR